MLWKRTQPLLAEIPLALRQQQTSHRQAYPLCLMQRLLKPYSYFLKAHAPLAAAQLAHQLQAPDVWLCFCL